MYEQDSLSYNSKYPSKVTDNIFQGGFYCAEQEDNLKKLGITHILVAGCYLKDNFPNSFKYFKLDVMDIESEDLSKHFDKVYEFINSCIENNGKILIHCAAGISRSSTCTLVYLIKKEKMSFDKGLELIRKGRACAWPNNGFTKQLKIWEEKCRKEENKN